MKLSREASFGAIPCPDCHVHSIWKARLQGLEVLQAAGALRVPIAILIIVPGRPYGRINVLIMLFRICCTARYSVLLIAQRLFTGSGIVLSACLSCLLSICCLCTAFLVCPFTDGVALPVMTRLLTVLLTRHVAQGDACSLAL